MQVFCVKTPGDVVLHDRHFQKDGKLKFEGDLTTLTSFLDAPRDHKRFNVKCHNCRAVVAGKQPLMSVTWLVPIECKQEVKGFPVEEESSDEDDPVEEASAADAMAIAAKFTPTKSNKKGASRWDM